MYAVVLAGGGGTRLWPLSRPECPKPFLRLLGEETLIQRTVARLAPLVEPRDVYVVVDRRHMALVAEQLPAIPSANVIGEPIGRNTAAAVALAAEVIGRPEDEVMLVLPADAYVADEAGFRAALATAAAVAISGTAGPAGSVAGRRRGPGRPARHAGRDSKPPGDGLRLRPREAAGPPGGGASGLRRGSVRGEAHGRECGETHRHGPGQLERRHLRLDPGVDPRPPRSLRA